jgi:hypothetical protein
VTDLLLLPDKLYVQRALPAAVMAMCVEFAERSGFDFRGSVRRALENESVLSFIKLPEEHKRRIAKLVYAKTSEVVQAMGGAKNEISRCLAAAHLVHHLGETGKVPKDSTAYMTAAWMLEEADQDGKEKGDWNDAVGAKEVAQAGRLKWAFLGL